MGQTARLRVGDHWVPLPRFAWLATVKTARLAVERVVAKLSVDERRVRDFLVTEIGRTAEPVAPDALVRALGLAPQQVASILDALEARMTFLYRNDAGEVVWAYPVTAHRTPHHLSFESGERCYGA